MRLSVVLGLVSAAIGGVSAEWYALDGQKEFPGSLQSYNTGEKIPIECISRQIDTGEHKFDAENNIIYELFPKCRETGQPLSLTYGVNEDVNCTVGLTDHLYHLFQLYIHQDVPYSCRVPIGSPKTPAKDSAFVPFTLNFRGHISESHLDIDPTLNILMTRPNSKEFNSLVSSVGWSSGTNTSRYVIGDFMTVQLAIRWYTTSGTNPFTPIAQGFYHLPYYVGGVSSGSLFGYLFLTVVITAISSVGLVYNYLSKKVAIKGYHSTHDSEYGFPKKD